MRILPFSVFVALLVLSTTASGGKLVHSKDESQMMETYGMAARGAILAKLCRELTGGYESDYREFSKLAAELKPKLRTDVITLRSAPQGIKVYERGLRSYLPRKFPSEQARQCKWGIRAARKAAKLD